MSQNPSFWISPKTQDGNSAVVTGGSIFASPISAAMLKYIIATWNDCIEGQIAIGRTCLIPANATQKDFVLAVTKLGELTLADFSRQPKFLGRSAEECALTESLGGIVGGSYDPLLPVTDVRQSPTHDLLMSYKELAAQEKATKSAKDKGLAATKVIKNRIEVQEIMTRLMVQGIPRKGDNSKMPFFTKTVINDHLLPYVESMSEDAENPVGSPDGLTVDKLISMLQPIMRIGFTAHQASLTMVTLHRKNKEHLIAFLQRVLNANNSLNKGLSEDAVSAGGGYAEYTTQVFPTILAYEMFMSQVGRKEVRALQDIPEARSLQPWNKLEDLKTLRMLCVDRFTAFASIIPSKQELAELQREIPVLPAYQRALGFEDATKAEKGKTKSKASDKTSSYAEAAAAPLADGKPPPTKRDQITLSPDQLKAAGKLKEAGTPNDKECAVCKKYFSQLTSKPKEKGGERVPTYTRHKTSDCRMVTKSNNRWEQSQRPAKRRKQ